MYIRLSPFILLFIVSVFVSAKEGYGQRRYANSVTRFPASNGGGVQITNHTNARSADGYTPPPAVPSDNLAAISATGSSAQGYLSLQFPVIIPANSGVWVRVSDRSVGAGGADISVQLYNGANPAPGLVSEYLEMSDGSMYYRATASGPSDRIRVTVKGGVVLLLNTSASIKVHYTFYEPPANECQSVLGYNSNVPLLLGLPVGSVTNPGHATDKDRNTAAVFQSLVGLGSTFSHTVYYSNLSNIGDAATVTFSVPPAPTLDLSVFNNIGIKTYRGTEVKANQSLGSLLSVDLLGLLRNGEKHTVSIPSDVFDRIEITYATGIGLLNNFRLWEVEPTPAKPTSPFAYPAVTHVCHGESATFGAQSASAGSILKWYDVAVGGTPLRTSSSNKDSYDTGPLSFTAVGDTVFRYVAASWPGGCPAETERVRMALIVSPAPIKPIIEANE